MKTEMTVAGYLKSRMEELGIAYMFGVAGNYTAPLLDTIIADKDAPIKIINNSNEITAGFAADGYARVKGKPAAVYVTYSVGAFTGLNPIAGSFVEKVPILMINGAPTNKETSNLTKNMFRAFVFRILQAMTVFTSICNLKTYFLWLGARARIQPHGGPSPQRKPIK